MRAISIKKVFPSAIKLGTIIAILVCLLFLLGVFEYPELGLLDIRYRLKGEAQPSEGIVIVGITQRCLNQLGQFPWPRTYHAQLIDFLKDAGAKVIVMDIFFAQPGQDPSIDQQLADAIKDAGNVILPVFMPYRIFPHQRDPVIGTRLVPGDNLIHVENLVESMPPFTEAALSQGHINMLPDQDGIYRKAPLAIKYSEKVFFCLGLEAAAKFLGVRPDQISWSPGYLNLPDKKIPLEDSKFAYIDFADIETRSARYAFSDVIRGLVPAGSFKDKLVFVGQTTQGLPNADILQTPLREKYGVTVQAAIANTFLKDFYFKRMPLSKTCLWIILLSVITCLVMIYVRTWSSAILTLSEFLSLAFVAANAFTRHGLIIESVPLALAIVFAFTGAVLYRIRFADTLVQAKELELDSILQAGLITADGLKTDRAHDVIMSTIINSVGARGLLLRWRNEKTNSYEKRYVYGSAGGLLKGPMSDAEQRLVDRVIQSRKAVLVRDTRRDSLFSGRPSGREPHSILCAPLLLKAEVVGTLSLFDKLVSGQPQEIYFDEEDLKLFLILTQQTAISLENARLFEEVNELFLGSIRALAGTIDAKDPYTHGHSQRVTANATAITEEMGLSEGQKKEIMISAILHDVGKVGIKDVILSKPGQLTSEERTMFDQHSEIGSKIMSPIGQLSQMLPIIRHHHESYDGKGYPDKLKAEQIPIGARIIAVADTFDAMTSDRPYRKALSDDAARQEINKLSGIQFDPGVVEAFNKVYAKGKIKRASYGTVVP